MARKGENIYHRQDGRWEGRYICGRKDDGSAHYRSVYGKSYKEVREQLRQMRAELRSARPRCDLTVDTILCDWLDQRRGRVKPSSYARYASLVQRHILPQLGKLRVTALTAKKLSEFITSQQRAGRLDGKGGLSPKMLSDLVAVLKSALRQHVFVEDLFSDLHLPAIRQKHPETMSKTELTRFTQAANTERSNAAVACLLALNTGLRLGELCALQWKDISFADQSVQISRTVLRLKNGLSLQTPKSSCSERTIPLTVELLRLLMEWKKNAAEDAFILTGTDRPLDPRTMQNRFHSFLKRHGLQNRNFHALRHDFASRCIACGADPKAVSELLGHSNVRITLQLYVHPNMEQKRRFMSAVSTIAPRSGVCV